MSKAEQVKVETLTAVKINSAKVENIVFGALTKHFKTEWGNGKPVTKPLNSKPPYYLKLDKSSTGDVHLTVSPQRNCKQAQAFPEFLRKLSRVLNPNKLTEEELDKVAAIVDPNQQVAFLQKHSPKKAKGKDLDRIAKERQRRIDEKALRIKKQKEKEKEEKDRLEAEEAKKDKKDKKDIDKVDKKEKPAKK